MNAVNSFEDGRPADEDDLHEWFYAMHDHT